MPVLPMKQTVVIKRSTGELDDWGNPIYDANVFISRNQTMNIDYTITVPCRVDEGSTLTRYMSSGTSSSETIVANARILFDKIALIHYDDLIAYTNELGETIENKPKEINVKRNGAGKPILTEVFL